MQKSDCQSVIGEVLVFWEGLKRKRKEVRRCSIKKVSCKILQNSQEKTCSEVLY